MQGKSSEMVKKKSKIDFALTENSQFLESRKMVPKKGSG